MRRSVVSLLFVALLAVCAGASGQTSSGPSSTPEPQRRAKTKDATSRCPHDGLPCDSGTFVYDGAGNIIRIGKDTYAYDGVSRLTEVQQPGWFIGQKFAYDGFGNLTSITDTSVSGGVVTASAKRDIPVETKTNRLKATAANPLISTDARGNVTTVGTTQYAYDALDMPYQTGTGAAAAYYMYNADGERVAIVGGSPTAVSGRYEMRDTDNKVLREYREDTPGSVKWSRDYIYRDGSLLASVVPKPDGSEQVLQYHLDHLGTPRLITRTDGTEYERNQYRPFGAEIDPPFADIETHKFTGHERDSADIDYMHARYYDNAYGRFLAVDDDRNFEKIAPMPQAWNRYAYVLNNPVHRTDPTGRCFWDVCAGEALAAAAIVTAAAAYVAAPSAVVPGNTNGQVLVQTAIAGVQAVGRAVHSLLPGKQQTTGVNPSTPITSSATPRSNPLKGSPGTTVQTTQPDGTVKQVRKYGSDGYPETDVDHDHDHTGAGKPHSHDWGRPSDGSPPTHEDRRPPRPPNPSDPKPQQ